jgi:hypothetical protein
MTTAAVLTTPPPGDAEIISPTIQATWSWIRGYAPWIKGLKLAFDDFGRDTGLVTRLNEVVRVGDILSGSQEKPCPCATRVDPGTPMEFAKDHGYVPPPPPEPVSILTPRKDPWNLPPNPPPELPKRTTRSYFVYYDPNYGSYVGRTYFQCELNAINFIPVRIPPPPSYVACTPEEKKEMFLTSFDEVVYIGNITDTPELFRLNPAKDFTSGNWASIKLARENHFK